MQSPEKKEYEISLFPGSEFQQETGRWLSEHLANAINAVARGHVSPTVDVARFREQLARRSFEEAEPLTELIEWVTDALQQGLVQMTHPRYFGLFNPAPSFPSVVADTIAAHFNPQICVWSHAPAAVEIEEHMIEQLAQKAGMPESSGGHFTSGGSEANNTAVVCALTRATPEFAELGARAFSGQPLIYVSRESHLAWLKIAHQLGIGRNAVRLIETDGLGRMDINVLQETIDVDAAAGAAPVMIAATAGTTNAGVVDPLHACADIARHHAIWFHVDAAWGGALVCSPRYRDVLDGMERADSVTIDAHKWFATTMGAGIFLTRHKHLLNEAFAVATDYMPSNDASVDYYVNSIQWSRRFIGLRLFLSLGAAGWSGYAAHVERGVALIGAFTDRLQREGWRLENDSKMAVACLTPPAGGLSVTEIVDAVVRSGNAWISETRFEGKAVIRVCMTNGRSTQADFDALADQLLQLTSK
ncbi:MAG: aminotransferase class V-fold PLP-dependent enzyme [Pseudomonadota bacterium]